MITRLRIGTSHLTMIATAITAMPAFPIWKLIPKYEFVSLFSALDELKKDPLLLHPYSRADPAVTDTFRATSMPSLVKVAHLLLGAIGEYTWESYRNVTHVVSIGGIPLASIEGYIKRYVAAWELAKEAELEGTTPPPPNHPFFTT